MADFDAGYAIAHRAYVKGLLAMYGDLASFPDANSTLRLTYGQVKGYSPRDCDYYGHQTTLDGVMEKEDSTNWEFVVSARLKELYQAGDFGLIRCLTVNAGCLLCYDPYNGRELR